MNARPPSVVRPVHVWLSAAVLSCATLLAVPAAEKDDAVTAAMRDALYAEEVKGDPAAALKAYEAVTARFEEQRDLAATALFRQAECLRKLDRPQDAAAVYRKVLLLFPDKDRLARLSRENLTALGEKVPDTMPAAASGDPTLTEEEQKELARVKAMAANSPDLLFEVGKASPSPFFLAAQKGHAAVLEWLLTNHPEEAKPHLSTALRDAVDGGQRKATEKLIAAGAKLDGMLLRALKNQRWSVLDLLLQAKGDPNEEGDGPAASAVYSASGPDRSIHGSLLTVALGGAGDVPLDVIASLLQAGANPEKPGLSYASQGSGSQFSVTPLGLAVQHRSPAVVARLLEARPDVNRPSDADAEPPLLLALKRRSEPALDAIVEALVAAGADWTVRASTGHTALHHAAAGGHTKWVAAALKASIDPNTKSNDGTTPLQSAQRGQNGYRAVPLLLEAGAKIEEAPKDGNWFAYACGFWPENPEALGALEALVKAGANVNEPWVKPNDFVGAPLAAAVRKNNSYGLKTIEFLLAHGAKPKDTPVLTDEIPSMAKTADRTALLAVFRPLWQAANWRDNPQLPNAIWFDDGETFLQKKQSDQEPGSSAPLFGAVFSKESALDGVPSLRQWARELVNNFPTAARDWTKATIKRPKADGSVETLPAFDVVAIAGGKGEAPALHWGDALSLAANDGSSQDRSYAPVREWANADPSMTVRIDLGEAGLVTNRTSAEASPLWDVKVGAQPPDLNTLIRQAGIPRDLLRLEPVVRRPGTDGAMVEITPSQTGIQNVMLRHGDIVSFSAPEPKPSLTADDLRSGVWLCEAEGGPFWPVNPMLKQDDWPALGYLVLALQAPHPGLFQSIDWSKALLRTMADSTRTEPLQECFARLPLTPGIMLILPPGQSATEEWPEPVRDALGKLTLDWSLRPSEGGVALPRTYRPRFFKRFTAGGRVMWTDTLPEASGPLLPRVSDLVQSDSARNSTLSASWNGDAEWIRAGMEITLKTANRSAPPRTRVVLPPPGQ